MPGWRGSVIGCRALSGRCQYSGSSVDEITVGAAGPRSAPSAALDSCASSIRADPGSRSLDRNEQPVVGPLRDRRERLGGRVVGRGRRHFLIVGIGEPRERGGSTEKMSIRHRGSRVFSKTASETSWLAHSR